MAGDAHTRGSRRLTTPRSAAVAGILFATALWRPGAGVVSAIVLVRRPPARQMSYSQRSASASRGARLRLRYSGSSVSSPPR